MRKNIKNIAMTLLILVMYIMIMTSPVLAAELPRTRIQVNVSLEGTLPTKAEEFTINLKSEDISNPMPSNITDEIYKMIVTGEDIKSLPEIVFSRVGIYRYTIWQDKGNNADCSYDNSVYYLTVYVTNKKDGEGLEATSVLYKENEANKLEEAKFNNVYKIITPIKEPVIPIKDNIETGDKSNAIFWAILSAIGAIGLFYVGVSSHKKSQEVN